MCADIHVHKKGRSCIGTIHAISSWRNDRLLGTRPKRKKKVTFDNKN